MKYNISYKSPKHLLARTAERARLIDVRSHISDSAELVEGDVLILRDGESKSIAARYAGIVAAFLADDQSAYELAGVYEVDPRGAELASLVDGNVGTAVPSGTQHDWGTMGLPDGPRTRVSPALPARDRDDVRLALESEGYAQYATNRRLSIGAGDVVTLGGRAATVVKVDRRDRSVEIEFDDGTTHIHALDEIAELEEEQ